MLTKHAIQVKEAMLVGAIRAARLSEEDKAVLRKEYGLTEDPNYIMRNAGRNFVGANVGTALGMGIGSGLGSLKGEGGASIGALLGSAIGGVTGSISSTDKYSKGRAEQIRERLRNKEK